jgi:hypothetical protein
MVLQIRDGVTANGRESIGPSACESPGHYIRGMGDQIHVVALLDLPHFSFAVLVTLASS